MNPDTSPPTEAQIAQPRNLVLRFFTHPAVSFTTAISSLISVPLAIFLFLQARESRELVYISHPDRTVIAHRERPGELKVEFAGEVLRDVDVVAIRFAFWNHGSLAIRPANVLSPAEINFTPPVRVLEVSVEKQSREIIDLSITSEKTLLQQGRIPISWRILERGDAAILQVIYAGPRDAAAKLKGVIEGQGVPRAVEPSAKKKSDEAKKEFGRLLPSTAALVGVLVVMLLFSSFVIGGGIGLLNEATQKGKRWFHHVVAYAVLTGGIFILVWSIYTLYHQWLGPTPPPGF